MSSRPVRLLRERRFAPLFSGRSCLGAANDNLFKSRSRCSPRFRAAEWAGLDPAPPASDRAIFIGLCLLGGPRAERGQEERGR